MVLLRYLEDNKEWTTIPKEEKQEGDLYLDGKLKNKLDHAKMKIKKDFDVGGIVIGDEGGGKSTHASNIMLYMTDCKFDPRRDIIKSHEDAILKLEQVPDGSGIMFDEGYLLFYSGDALTKSQKAITKIFSIIRQKNLFFLIVAPSFFRLATYFALDRTKFLIRVYDKAGERGYFSYWGPKRKEKLYRIGKPKHNYNIITPAFRGRFTKCSLLDEQYKEIKKETLREAFKEARANQKKEPTKREIIRDFKLEFVKNNPSLKDRELAELLKCSVSSIEKYKAQLRELSQQIISNIATVSRNSLTEQKYIST
jgi:hypothetical protein